MDAPIQPLNANPPAATPPLTPSPPTAVGVPMPAPIQAPPPVQPTPMPSPKPPTPPPAPAPIPTPATPPPTPPRPVAPPAATPSVPLPHKPRHWLRWFLILVLLFVLGILAFLFAWPMIQKTQAPVTPPAVIQTESPTSTTPVETPPPSPTTTTTAPVATQPTTPKGYGGLDVYKFGDKAQLFTGEQVAFSNDVASNRALKIGVTSFTDSRCHAGVQCIWAGEQGVNLHVTNLETGQELDVYLGLVRAKTMNIFGHLFTLNEIDEGKGGTFAEIRVE